LAVSESSTCNREREREVDGERELTSLTLIIFQKCEKRKLDFDAAKSPILFTMRHPISACSLVNQSVHGPSKGIEWEQVEQRGASEIPVLFVKVRVNSATVVVTPANIFVLL